MAVSAVGGMVSSMARRVTNRLMHPATRRVARRLICGMAGRVVGRMVIRVTASMGNWVTGRPDRGSSVSVGR
ncbi:MAG: hypothetical protein NTX53_05570 [candidate division WOR-3 bacterium]|nr:hypothetical protein [candidate division WOR-3 bacterium]